MHKCNLNSSKLALQMCNVMGKLLNISACGCVSLSEVKDALSLESGTTQKHCHLFRDIFITLHLACSYSASSVCRMIQTGSAHVILYLTVLIHFFIAHYCHLRFYFVFFSYVLIDLKWFCPAVALTHWSGQHMVDIDLVLWLRLSD